LLETIVVALMSAMPFAIIGAIVVIIKELTKKKNSMEKNLKINEPEERILKVNFNIEKESEGTIVVEKREQLETVLKQNCNEQSIVQGRILQILSNTIVVAHNDDKNDVIEVRNYPADKIVDEVWVKIKVKYLFSQSNLTQVVEFIETIEKF